LPEHKKEDFLVTQSIPAVTQHVPALNPPPYLMAITPPTQPQQAYLGVLFKHPNCLLQPAAIFGKDFVILC
jgi:hypothetical protein